MVEQQDNDRIKGHSFLIDNILRREDNSPGTDKTAEIALITVHREQSSKVTQNIVAFPTEPNENSPRLTDIQGLCGCPDNNTDTSPECQLKLRHKKKTRTVFSRHQIFYLESAFEMKRYLSSTERSEMARSLKLTETQVKVWFQNRRNKWKSQMSGQDSYSPEPPLFPVYSPFPTDPRLQQRLAMLHNMPPLFY